MGLAENRLWASIMASRWKRSYERPDAAIEEVKPLYIDGRMVASDDKAKLSTAATGRGPRTCRLPGRPPKKDYLAAPLTKSTSRPSQANSAAAVPNRLTAVSSP